MPNFLAFTTSLEIDTDELTVRSVSVDKFVVRDILPPYNEDLPEHRMVQRNRLLSRAINGGESAVRHVLRDLQSQHNEIWKTVRYRGKEIRADEAIEARQQICELDRLIGYATLALANLPAEGIARARAIKNAIETVLQLGTD